MCGGRLAAIVVVLPLALARAEPVGDDADPDTEVARKHFAGGSEFYKAGQYEEALKEFVASRRAKKLPAFDYNIGRCLDRLERYPEAIVAYRRYVEAAPEAGDAAEVKERVRVLEERLAEEARERPAAPAPAPAAAIEPSRVVAPPAPVEPNRVDAAAPRSGGSFILPIALGGVAVIAAGAALGLFYGSVVPDFNALLSGPTSCRPCDPSQYADVQTRANVSYGLAVAAGVVAAVDVVLWIYQLRRGGSVKVARFGAVGRF